MASAKEIVEQYKAVLGRGDFTAARQLLHDDLLFEGPIDSFNRADEYLEVSKRLATIATQQEGSRIYRWRCRAVRRSPPVNSPSRPSR